MVTIDQTVVTIDQTVVTIDQTLITIDQTLVTIDQTLVTLDQPAFHDEHYYYDHVRVYQLLQCTHKDSKL